MIRRSRTKCDLRCTDLVISGKNETNEGSVEWGIMSKDQNNLSLRVFSRACWLLYVYCIHLQVSNKQHFRELSKPWTKYTKNIAWELVPCSEEWERSSLNGKIKDTLLTFSPQRKTLTPAVLDNATKTKTKFQTCALRRKGEIWLPVVLVFVRDEAA